MENKERNSNVILLVVIAIATMVIVVIGATFAYLASTATANSAVNVNAGFQEGESDLLLIDAGKDLSVEATYDNFGKGEGHQSDFDIAKVILQAASNSSAHYNYDVYLETESNDMEYTSGACYKKTASVVTLNNDRASCTGDNVWAKVSGTSLAACYEKPTTEKIESAIGESERACLTSNSNMWVLDDDVTELAFDVYRPVPGVTTEAACTANPTDTPDTSLGVCLDKQRGITTINYAKDCTDAGNYWVPNYFDADSSECYKIVNSLDITLVQDGEVKLFENVEISAEDGATVTHNYRVGVTILNLPHNQIANSGHKYRGRLNIKVNQPETPSTGDVETPGA